MEDLVSKKQDATTPVNSHLYMHAPAHNQQNCKMQTILIHTHTHTHTHTLTHTHTHTSTHTQKVMLKKYVSPFLKPPGYPAES
jgi:carbohydrate-binding DOMON domain-containing protein